MRAPYLLPLLLPLSLACFSGSTTNLVHDPPRHPLERFLPDLNQINPGNIVPSHPLDPRLPLNPTDPRVIDPNALPNDLDPFDLDPSFLFPRVPPTAHTFSGARAAVDTTTRVVTVTTTPIHIRTTPAPAFTHPPPIFDNRIPEQAGPQFPEPRPFPFDLEPVIRDNTASPQNYPRHCADIQTFNRGASSGPYTVYRPSCLNPERCATKVFCDLETDGGGWTVIHQRLDGSVDFFRDWQSYKRGFGDERNFWIGNEYLYEMTNMAEDTNILLTIELTSFKDESSFVMYDKFKVASEAHNYTLSLGKLFGNHPVDNLEGSRGQSFSTHNVDNDKDASLRCADIWSSGWWHARNCDFSGDLNTPYNQPGVQWISDTKGSVLIKEAQMKIRPSDFEPVAGLPVFSDDDTNNVVFF